MFVSTRYPTLLALLLLMATLQPYRLLPTEQSSLVPSLVHKMKASDFVINTTSNHTLGNGNVTILGSPDGYECLYVVEHYRGPVTEGARCRAYQQPWLNLILEKGVHLVDPEYTCKDDYLNIYCNTLMGRNYCKKQYFDALLEDVKQELVDDAQKCSPWLNWQPPVESLMEITDKMTYCEDTLRDSWPLKHCQKEVREAAAKWNITDLTEFWCKREYEFEKCTIKEACYYCGSSWNGDSRNSIDEFFDYVGSIWSPKLVECTQWASEEPKLVCPVTEATTEIPITSPVPSTNVSSTFASSTLLPSTPDPSKTLNPVLAICELVLLENGQPGNCLAEAAVKYPNPTGHNVEKWCKGTYYAIDCALKAACKYCATDTKDAEIDEARKGVDLIREQCEIWSNDEPKLKCATTTSSMSTLMIVGIVFGVIVILAVIIAPHVIVYYMCCTSSSEAGSSNPTFPSQAKQDTPTERSSKVVATFAQNSPSQVPRSYGCTRLVQALPTQANQEPLSKLSSQGLPTLQTQANQDSPTERSSKVMRTFPSPLVKQIPRSYGKTRLMQALPTLSKPGSSVGAKQLSR